MVAHPGALDEFVRRKGLSDKSGHEIVRRWSHCRCYTRVWCMIRLMC
jgi:hypothetical protein